MPLGKQGALLRSRKGMRSIMGRDPPMDAGMTLDLGFYLCLAVAGWLTIGPLTARRTSERRAHFAVFGLIIALWSVGELLVMDGETLEELAFARRVFYLGAAGLPPAWLWLAAHTARPAWFRARPWLVSLPFLLPAFLYSSLFWDADARFVSLGSSEPIHGPWFEIFVPHQYLAALAGSWLFGQTAIRMGRSNLRVLGALALGMLLPISANLLYVFEIVATDFTAVALAPAALLLWLAVTESDLASSLPLERQELIEQLDVGVVVADTEGRVVSANPAAERLTQIGSLRGRSLAEAVAAAEQRDDAVIESRAITVQGRFGVIGHALILNDRTEAEATRRRLELGGRLEALGSLTAGIAHEVNNPLTYIQANLCSLESTAKLLQSEPLGPAPSEPVRRAIEDLGCLVEETQEGVERIRLLVQRLGNFSRTPDLGASAVEVDVASVARQAGSIAGLGRPPDRLRVEAEPDLRILTIEHAVFQILVNLMLNAVQAAGEDALVRVSLARNEHEIVVRVEDEGPGIPEQVLPRIFDPFFTTKPSGMGLGLSLSYDLATRLGGLLEAANREGGGAVFTLRLRPIAPEGNIVPACPADVASVSAQAVGQAAAAAGEEPAVA